MLHLETCGTSRTIWLPAGWFCTATMENVRERVDSTIIEQHILNPSHWLHRRRQLCGSGCSIGSTTSRPSIGTRQQIFAYAALLWLCNHREYLFSSPIWSSTQRIRRFLRWDGSTFWRYYWLRAGSVAHHLYSCNDHINYGLPSVMHHFLAPWTL